MYEPSSHNSPHQHARQLSRYLRTILTPDERAALVAEYTAPPVWAPQHRAGCAGGDACACPQVRAYHSDAHVIGYGGAAGGGKTDLLLGFAGTAHRRSIIYRRVFPSVRAIIERSREIFARDDESRAKDSYNEQLHVWRLADGRMIEFGAVQYDKDAKKQQGQARDFIGFDEATEFPESVVRFLMGWNRTTTPQQRCRVVMTFNPPMDDSGAWVVKFFAPWLDPASPDRARDGDVRWVARIDDKDVFFVNKEDAPPEVRATLKTRTFFHASLKDNPILAATGYGATIEALPEPLRSFLKGNFGAAQAANPWQVIPRAWVEQAQRRWTPEPPGPLSALGVDVARGGQDETALCPRHGTWYGPIESYPGRATPDGPSVAALVIARNPGEALVGVDVIGVGGSAYDQLVGIVQAMPINVSEKSLDTDRSGKLRFANLRSALWWQLREALDPQHGDGLMLPDDPVLREELTAPRFEVRGGVIHVESKDTLRERLGRSTNRADALLLSRAIATGWLLA
jgi:hypothetical protein